jgi:hypothetical protein
MKLEICVKSFVLAVIYFGLSLALTSGKVQEIINFNSVSAEVGLCLLLGCMGLLCLIASIKIRR